MPCSLQHPRRDSASSNTGRAFSATRRSGTHERAARAAQSDRDLKSDRRLTLVQFQALRIIAHWIRTKGAPPTAEDLGRALWKTSRQNAHLHMQALERKGYIKRETGKARALVVLRDYAVVRVRGMS